MATTEEPIPNPTRNKSRDADAPAERHHWLEVLALVSAGLAFIHLLALISYTPGDFPAWAPFGHPGAGGSLEIINYVGPFGALLAGYSYKLFGAASYLVPPMIAWLGAAPLAGAHLGRWRTAGALLGFFVSACCLLEFQPFLFHDWILRYQLPNSAGGITGYIFAHLAIGKLIGLGGGAVVMSAVFILSTILILGYHPFQLSTALRKQLREREEREAYRPEPVRNVTPMSITAPVPVMPESSGMEMRPAANGARPRPNHITYTKPVAPPLDPEQNRRAPRIIDSNERKKKDGKRMEIEYLGDPLHDYRLPSLELMDYAPEEAETPLTDKAELLETQATIIETLKTFNISVTPGDITKGPTITRYEIYPSKGLRVKQIAALEADIARATLAERINILAPIPGRDTVGIEIANNRKVVVHLGELLEDAEFTKGKAQIPIALGKDVYGKTIIADLAAMPHLLVAGATGSGKSVCINSIITSLLYRFSPDEMKFIMIDPKVVEMQVYDSLPHLAVPVVTDPKKAPLALRWCLNEMERRYEMFARAGCRKLEEFNHRVERGIVPPKPARHRDMAQLQLPYNDEVFLPGPGCDESRMSAESSIDDLPERLPFIVVIIDELADLMQTAAAEVETSIARLCQKARAAGIHLIVATQSPRVDVVTGLIKANIPARIAFQVASLTDSRVILDKSGAEKLVGKGDMLFQPPDSAVVLRAQGAFMREKEVKAVVDHCSGQARPFFDAEIEDSLGEGAEEEGPGELSAADEETLQRCIEVILADKKASTSFLQRRLRLGYNRAARMMDLLQERGIVGPGEGAKPREILIDLNVETA